MLKYCSEVKRIRNAAKLSAKDNMKRHKWLPAKCAKPYIKKRYIPSYSRIKYVSNNHKTISILVLHLFLQTTKT